MNLKPVPIPPEQTAFKKGVPMSEQLRKERAQVEKSAIRQKATPDELGAPRKRGPKRRQIESTAIRGRAKDHDAPVIAPHKETTKDERLGISPMNVKLPILTATRIREYSEKHNISQREIFRQAIALFFGDKA